MVVRTGIEWYVIVISSERKFKFVGGLNLINKKKN